MGEERQRQGMVKKMVVGGGHGRHGGEYGGEHMNEDMEGHI